MLIPLLLVVAVYLAMCVLVALRQRDLMYFPALTRAPANETDLTLVVEDLKLRAWVVNPGQARAIVYFGGNAESVQFNREAFAKWFPGHTVYLPAYRGYGASEGEPREAALQGDALVFFDHAASRHATVDLIGRSLGSGVAAHVASMRPVRKLALVTPFDRMASVAGHHYPWLPVERLLTERYQTAAALTGFGGEVLVVRAQRDDVVPAASTRNLIDTLPASSTRVVSLAEAGHNTVDRDPAYGESLRAFMDRDGDTR
ncbi:alpha/beta hydrolase [Lysobacter sp. A3-1-A15]|uniref:alpha/beta hydrolase n=1 Tax=Novilysobacter viscosus TaxID=3098602 RepID=UPI002EDB17A2